MSAPAYRIRQTLEPFEPFEPFADRVADRSTIDAPATSPEQVVRIVRSLIGEEPRETFSALYLDNRHRPIAIELVSIGTLNSALVHPREVLGPALRIGTCVALVVAHNHPSGDPQPSDNDHAVTERLRSAAELLGLTLVDHVILGADERFYSYRRAGRLS